MYLIRAKVEAMYEEYEFSGDKESLNGILITEDELSKLLQEENDELSNLLKEYHIEQYTNSNNFWYILNKTILVEELGFDASILPKGDEGEYIVNYKTSEVIYTPGIKDESNETKYKLSDFEKKE